MRKNSYTQAVDTITASDRAVEKMLCTVRIFDKKERNIYMKGFGFKGAVAASLAVLTVLVGIIGFDSFNSRENSVMPENSTVKENSFVITANAEEISEEKSAAVSITDGYGLGYSLNGDGNVEYELDLSLECRGDNISTVTYSVDKDVIEVMCRKDNNPVIQGERAKHMRFEDYGESLENDPEAEHLLRIYSSITLDYNNQNPEGFNFGIIGVGDDEITAHKEQLFNIYGSVDELNLESQNNWIGKLIGNKIHCTVAFNDGTVQMQDIIIGTKISTYSREFPEEYSSFPDDIKEENDFTGVFVTYSLA